jgi:uncharacterized membrane protein
MPVDLNNPNRRVPLPTKKSGLNFDLARQRMAEREQARQNAITNSQQSSEFPTQEPESVKKSLRERIASYTGGLKIAQGLGQGLAMGSTKTTLDSIQAGEGEMQQKLIQAIRKNKIEGKDTSRLEASLKALTGSIEQTGTGAEDLYNPNKLTTKQVVGDALQLGATVVGAGSLPSTAKSTVKAVGIKAGALQGAKVGAATGAGFGGVTGFAQGLQKDKSITDSLKDAGIGLVGGAVTGGVVGGLVGGISGAIKGRNLRKEILNKQEEVGLRPSLTESITERAKKDSQFNVVLKEAKKQGFDDSEINFLATVSDEDKPVLDKMYKLTVKAQSDPRQITRAGDILGENVTNQVKQVINLNKEAGKAVDLTAKALRGESIDVTPLAQNIITKLDDVGVAISPNGQLNFEQSVFKNTPSIQKEIQKVISSIPDGSDAYQLHIFKKSIDEMVDYGTTGEGLKGSAANILKSFRSYADDILDTTFEEYNSANSFYKQTRDYIDMAKGVVGKKVDLSSKEGTQAFGQALRSAFSNNKSRPNTLKFIEDTHLISKELGLSGSEKNLLDQALFVNILEETFGTEAATGLAGEVSKAINKTMSVIDGVRNPITGVANLAASVAEKTQNITPQAKQNILNTLVKNASDKASKIPESKSNALANIMKYLLKQAQESAATITKTAVKPSIVGSATGTLINQN